MSGAGRAALCLAAILLVLIFGSACGGDSNNNKSSGPTSVSTAVSQASGAKAQLCDSLDGLKNSVGEVQQLNSSSTVDDAKKAQQNVQNSLNNVKSAADASSAARVTVLQTAQQAISDAINQISGSQTLGQVASTLKTQASAISSALDGLRSDAKCQ